MGCFPPSDTFIAIVDKLPFIIATWHGALSSLTLWVKSLKFIHDLITHDIVMLPRAITFWLNNLEPHPTMTGTDTPIAMIVAPSPFGFMWYASLDTHVNRLPSLAYRMDWRIEWIGHGFHVAMAFHQQEGGATLVFQ